MNDIQTHRSLFFWALLRTCIGAVDFPVVAFHLCAPPLPGATPRPPRAPPLKNLPLPYIGRKDLEVSTYERDENYLKFSYVFYLSNVILVEGGSLIFRFGLTN